MKVCWRFIIATLMAAVIVMLQGIQLNLGVLFAYMWNETKRFNSSNNLSTPKFFDFDKNGQMIQRHFVFKFITFNFIYFCMFMLVATTYFSRIFLRRRAPRFCLLSLVVILAIVPLLCTLSFTLPMLAFTRVLQGLLSAHANGIIFDYLAMWIPPNERSSICGFVYGSMALAVALSIWFTDIISQSTNWNYVFYIGTPVMVLVGIALGLVTSVPELHPFISDEEKDYINYEFGGRVSKNDRRPRVKLQQIFEWVPFLTAVFITFCFFTGWFVVLFVLPLYLEQIHGFQIFANTNLTAIPFVCAWPVSIIFGIAQDVLIARNIMSATETRKICILTSSVILSVCFLLLNVGGKTFVICVIWILIITMGAGLTGIFSNLLDIAPNFANTIMISANTAVVSAFIYIYVSYILLQNVISLWPYRLIFGVTSGFYVIAFVCVPCISADAADWNDPEE